MTGPTAPPAVAPQPPALVTLHLWGVARAKVPVALLRMGLDRAPLRRTPGLRFAKLLGTGDGRTFTVRDADPRHWGLVAAWTSEAAATRFEQGSMASAWRRCSDEVLRVALRPLASRGRWAGQQPFGEPTPSKQLLASATPVAAITRARLAARKAVTFWRAIPPVSEDLHRCPGLRLAVGIGEAPIGLQGTFSLWESNRALTDFAARRAPHQEAVRRTAEERWYAEELFARFAVLDVAGTFQGKTP